MTDPSTSPGPEADGGPVPPGLTGVQWIERWAAELGVPAPGDDVIEVVLDLAGVAAHSSERLAAPLACYLVGVAGLDPVEALARARRLAGPADPD